MGDISKVKLPDNSVQNIKDTEAREMLETKMPIYTIGTPTVLVDTTTVSFSKDGDNNWYISGENPIMISLPTARIYDSIYIVEWDGVTYKLFLKVVFDRKPVRLVTGTGTFTWYSIGNVSPLGYCSTEADMVAPFAITTGYMKNTHECYLLSYDTAASHTVKISIASFSKVPFDYAYYDDIRNYGNPVVRTTSNYGVVESGAINAIGQFAHAEGKGTIASGPSGSHAEGFATSASGQQGSHAEGSYTTASGAASHAEGGSNTASGNFAHTEGYGTLASGGSSHAEGRNTTASGSISHTEGEYTTANHKYQHVFGKANIEDPSTEEATNIGNYVEIVGNGTWETIGGETAITRSNARTLDWNGNEVLAGSVTANGGFIGDLTGNATSATNASTVNNLTVQTSVPANAVFTDTKNTTGSTDTSSKIYLVGATSQAANPQTYSDDEVYATSGVVTTKSVQIGGGAASLVFNTTTSSIDFVFA